MTDTPIKGYLVSLQVGDGESPEAFSTFAGSRDISISFGENELDATSADDVDELGRLWKSYVGGTIDLQISFEGLIKSRVDFVRVMGDRFDDTVRNYRVTVDGFAIYAGPGRITVSNPSSTFDELATLAITIRGAGPWTFTPVV